MKKVTLLIGEEEFAFAERMAKEEDFVFGPEDYLHGLLMRALLEEIDEFENGPLRPWPEQDQAARAAPDEPDWFDELEEDEGGGMRLKADGDELPDFDDLDDGIPF